MIIAGVVLAAGNSSRLGYNKQFVKFSGQYLINRAVDKLQQINIHQIFVIAGFEHEKISEVLSNTICEVVVNKEWRQGLGTSIALAAAHIVSSEKSFDAALFVLPDQFMVSENYLRDFLSRAHSSQYSILASSYAGTYGPPVLFRKNHFRDLGTLSGTKGAKSYILTHQNDFDQIKCGEAEVDIDTPDDLSRFLREYPELSFH